MHIIELNEIYFWAEMLELHCDADLPAFKVVLWGYQQLFP